MKSPARSGWWQNRPNPCVGLPVNSGTHETQALQLVATLPGRVANAPEAGPSGQSGVGAGIGQSGAGGWLADTGPGQAPRADPGQGSVAGLPGWQTRRADQAGR